MKPYEHAATSVRKWGGVPEDYLPIHDKLDSSKQSLASMQHRAMYHHSHGCYIMEELFGHNITNSEGKLVSVREIAELHILEDLGKIPTLAERRRFIPLQSWMCKTTKVQQSVSFGRCTICRNAKRLGNQLCYFTQKILANQIGFLSKIF